MGNTSILVSSLPVNLEEDCVCVTERVREGRERDREGEENELTM